MTYSRQLQGPYVFAFGHKHFNEKHWNVIYMRDEKTYQGGWAEMFWATPIEAQLKLAELRKASGSVPQTWGVQTGNPNLKYYLFEYHSNAPYVGWRYVEV